MVSLLLIIVYHIIGWILLKRFSRLEKDCNAMFCLLEDVKNGKLSSVDVSWLNTKQYLLENQRSCRFFNIFTARVDGYVCGKIQGCQELVREYRTKRRMAFIHVVFFIISTMLLIWLFDDTGLTKLLDSFYNWRNRIK